MPGPVFLRGETVTLHPIEEADLDFFRSQLNDPRVWRTISHREPTNARQEREWWESLDEADGVDLLVAASVDGERTRVGHIGFGDVQQNWGVAELGYAIHPDHWNEGYATAAVALLTAFAFDERRLEKLVATVYEHNPASMRALEKAGFHEEAVLDREAFVGGERVDLHRYAAFTDGWERPE
ncbi:GNAT family N-acetyltransferase [Haloglomus litoreum]|uniref:GNAT family N-acetyltransferase n=1 Tax=Haloglomus litoreum TaxID=3034026 RepID=UPI0023E8F7E2|nr:GNAT family protein [Haloglomus sp. DT116]